MTTINGQRSGWRVVDIVVAAAVAVAFGIVFLAWNALYAATVPIFAFLPPAQAIMYGVWLLPAVLVGLIVRRPGAAIFGGLVSAAVSVVLGSPYGVDALVSGAIQGAGAELAFAIGLYRRWTLPFAVLAGALAGLFAAVARHPDLLPRHRRRLLARLRRRVDPQRGAGRRRRRRGCCCVRSSRPASCAISRWGANSARSDRTDRPQCADAGGGATGADRGAWLGHSASRAPRLGAARARSDDRAGGARPPARPVRRREVHAAGGARRPRRPVRRRRDRGNAAGRRPRPAGGARPDGAALPGSRVPDRDGTRRRRRRVRAREPMRSHRRHLAAGRCGARRRRLPVRTGPPDPCPVGR